MDGKSWVAAGVVLAFAGCGGGSPSPPPTTARQVAPPPPAPPPADVPRREVADVTIQRVVLEICRIPTPHFAFDSADVRPRAEDPLQRLADCFLTGPLAGREVLLIGHTDPRGPAPYNIALGQQRAHAVADALERAGVPADRVNVMSRGELYASGNEPSSWAADRRVEIGIYEEE
jgi:peptidoglycan-associated lipoprotein